MPPIRLQGGHITNMFLIATNESVTSRVCGSHNNGYEEFWVTMGSNPLEIYFYSLLHADFLLFLLLNLDDRRDVFLRNVG
jgi:hypothetical protein